MTNDAQTVAMFIDYDNVERSVRQDGVETVIRTVLRTVPAHVLPPGTSVTVRLYGGWYQRHRLSATAQALKRDIRASFPSDLTLTSLDRPSEHVPRSWCTAESAAPKLPFRRLCPSFGRVPFGPDVPVSTRPTMPPPRLLRTAETRDDPLRTEARGHHAERRLDLHGHSVTQGHYRGGEQRRRPLASHPHVGKPRCYRPPCPPGSR